MKQFNFQVPDEVHRQIKTIAAMNNMSMSLWIIKAIKREYDYQSKELMKID